MKADLNLVPFIDLLSVCITFLLLAAVWTQVQALSIETLATP
jgi:biopolymer transport protein ExbD